MIWTWNQRHVQYNVYVALDLITALVECAHFSHARAHTCFQFGYILDVRMDIHIRYWFQFIVIHSIHRFAWHFFFDLNFYFYSVWFCVCVSFVKLSLPIAIVSCQLNSSVQKESNAQAWGDHYCFCWCGYFYFIFLFCFSFGCFVPGILISVYFSTTTFLSCTECVLCLRFFQCDFIIQHYLMHFVRFQKIVYWFPIVIVDKIVGAISFASILFSIFRYENVCASF